MPPYIPTGDATVVARMRSAGAILLGVTNVPEFACWFESDNLVYGRTNNPYDVSRTPGGSSGGEAAIIAAGGSPLGLGSDGGGSIRLPVHFCGIAGIKPTTGRVPNTGHYPRVTWTMGSAPANRPIGEVRRRPHTDAPCHCRYRLARCGHRANAARPSQCSRP